MNTLIIYGELYRYTYRAWGIIMDSRRKALEDYAKSVEEGLPFADDFVPKSSDLEDRALKARNLSEDSLANQVMKNTGVPIPDKTASTSKKLDSLQRLIQEQYPELSLDVKPSDGDYYQKGGIFLNKGDLDKGDFTKSLGKGFHEAGHQFDDKIIKQPGKNLDLKTIREMVASGIDVKNLDPAQLYEGYAKGHHASIPDLREGSFGLGALKSYMKKGGFKSVAPLLGGAAGLAYSGASEAADTEAMGDAPEQAALLRESDEHNRRQKALAKNPELAKLYEGLDSGKSLEGNARRAALIKLGR
jgi:hypothetical protein